MKPGLSPEEYLAQNRAQRGEGPARWAELMSTRPFMYKRMQALELFAQSEVYAEVTGEDVRGKPISREELDRRTLAIVAVS